MPNWCFNKLGISGPTESLLKIEADLFAVITKSTDGHLLAVKYEIDFNKIIPYPKEYKERDDIANKLREETAGMDEASRDLYLLMYGYRDGIPKDGFNTGGYEWCVRYWGTKWNACDPTYNRDEDQITIEFSTAWSPPIPIIQKMSEMFPGLIFDLSFKDEGDFEDCIVFERGCCSE